MSLRHVGADQRARLHGPRLHAERVDHAPTISRNAAQNTRQGMDKGMYTHKTGSHRRQLGHIGGATISTGLPGGYERNTHIF